MTSSNFVDCSTGRSAGLAPLKNFTDVDALAGDTHQKGLGRSSSRLPAAANSRHGHIGGQRLQRCECDDLFVPAKKKRVSAYEKRAGPQVGKGSRRLVSISLAVLARTDMQHKLRESTRRPAISCFGLGIAVVLVDKQSDDGRLRHDFV